MGPKGTLAIALFALLLPTTGDARTTSRQAPEPALAIADGSVVEGETGTFLRIVVKLRNATGRRVTVDYVTRNGTARAGQDFTATSGRLTFRDTRVRRTVRIPVFGDTHDEDPETFYVLLRDPRGASISDRKGVATIRDNDVTLTIVREGTGVISSDLAGIDCGDDCSQSFPQGTTITLTAEPTAPSLWIGWSGPCSGTDPCVVALADSTTVTATFEDYRTVSVSLPGQGVDGVVTSQPQGIACGAYLTFTFDECQATFPTTATIYLNAQMGGIFLGWGGEECSAYASEPFCVISPGSHDVEVQALFSELPP